MINIQLYRTGNEAVAETGQRNECVSIFVPTAKKNMTVEKIHNR